jgi:hypothetical protein
LRDVALCSDAGSFKVAGQAKELKAGLELPAQSVNSHAPQARLDRKG